MINPNTKVVPIDHGWANMKTEQDVFTSGVSEITTEPALFNDVLEYNNKYYKIGGNGWNVGRQTANGLLNNCTRVSKNNAKPGDLIFFQGTYDTSGASHVGIYVGDGMMIHCGNPIQYASINSSYWQSHFYTFGRLNH